MCNEIQRHRRNPVREILLRPTFSLMDFTTSLDGVFTLHGTRGGPEWMVVIWRNVHIAPWPGKVQGIGSINDGLPTHSATRSSTTGYIVSGFLIPFTGPCTAAMWMFLFYIAPGSCPKKVSAKLNKNYELLCVGTDREHIIFLPIITVEPTGNQTVCSLQNTLDPRSESKLFYCKL